MLTARAHLQRDDPVVLLRVRSRGVKLHPGTKGELKKDESGRKAGPVEGRSTSPSGTYMYMLALVRRSGGGGNVRTAAKLVAGP